MGWNYFRASVVLFLIQSNKNCTIVLGHCHVHCITAPQSLFRGDIHGEFSERFI